MKVGKTPWTEQVKKWRTHVFSLADREENASALLRKAADAIDELGQIELLDITFSLQTRGQEFECQVTVYFVYQDEPLSE
jgi:hypothetical protein